jgi:hypothetical protein
MLSTQYASCVGRLGRADSPPLPLLLLLLLLPPSPSRTAEAVVLAVDDAVPPVNSGRVMDAALTNLTTAIASAGVESQPPCTSGARVGDVPSSHPEAAAARTSGTCSGTAAAARGVCDCEDAASPSAPVWSARP